MSPSNTVPVLPFRCQRRIEFSETDAAGLFHFSGYFRLMEFAEAAFFRSLGWPLLQHADGLSTGFPRIRCNARFRRPLRFEDLVEIVLDIESVESNRIHYRFEFFKVTDGDNLCVAKGEMSVVHVQTKCPADDPVPAPMPQGWKEKLASLIAGR